MTRSLCLAIQLYSVQQRDRILVKDFGFLSFPRNMDKVVGKNINKSLSSKYNQKLLDHAKQSAIDVLKTSSKRAIQKTAEATDDLIGNKIADKITGVSKTLPNNNSGTNEEEILTERFIPSELIQETIDDLRLKEKSYWLF